MKSMKDLQAQYEPAMHVFLETTHFNLSLWSSLKLTHSKNNPGTDCTAEEATEGIKICCLLF